ncbi:cation diffusion facilitator family transporter [Streptomyces brasiliensis]|uniref:Membrane protein n=1 Tax=Streptomyces brasiliensis TaxID=1954 RepID=A0A917NFW1_9ACTN|nr:cation diffusion facilitator family transporter [Streptomyces brasiliensis]GGI94037.1 membrane protein [Streptomyces brasiliensis]
MTPQTTGQGGRERDGRTRVTVLVALGANVVIAAAKAAAGLLAASPALLSEAAHSVADSLNEVFLLIALRRSRRPADRRHPFGYGKERYFWALPAAVGIFVTGGCFSVYQGLHALRSGAQESHDGYVAGLAVLGVVLAAAAGMILHLVTGQVVWEAAASLGIGLLLVYVAYRLSREARDRLIGEAVGPDLSDRIRSFLASQEEIDNIASLLTMRLGLGSVLVAARVDLAPGIDSERVEPACLRIRRQLTEQWPQADQMFLDITEAPKAKRYGTGPSRGHRVSHRLPKV